MPTFLPERASHAGWASQFDEETAHSDQKREINGQIESRLLGLIFPCVTPIMTAGWEKGEIAVAVEDHEC